MPACSRRMAAVFSISTPAMGLLGILALVFSAAGWIHARRRSASNRGAAVAGYVLGIATLAAGVIGTF